MHHENSWSSNSELPSVIIRPPNPIHPHEAQNIFCWFNSLGGLRPPQLSVAVVVLLFLLFWQRIASFCNLKHWGYLSMKIITQHYKICKQQFLWCQTTKSSRHGTLVWLSSESRWRTPRVAFILSTNGFLFSDSAQNKEMKKFVRELGKCLGKTKREREEPCKQNLSQLRVIITNWV